jgi:FKBP-type peptidyl-prolyl cis-trans isomerase
MISAGFVGGNVEMTRYPLLALWLTLLMLPMGMALAGCDGDAHRQSATASIPAPADVAAPPAGSLKTTSGLSTLVLQPGTGKRHPRPTDRVTVHYSGWTTDGKMFDSSVASGAPASFAVNGVIAGWTEGLQMMVEGEKRRFWIPESLAYKGQSGSPQGMLVFDVELIKIQ